MCGIAGILELNTGSVPQTVLDQMTDALQHRGPDGRGTYVDGPVGLGHRRLSIIDLSEAGHQPMSTEDGRYSISYNGEVYNFRELREELLALGHDFHSTTDSEVVLKAFAEWGSAALNRFNGMFAFAIWDRQEKALFLARDRYGIKPLYYTRVNGALLFGSEIKAFLPHPGFTVRLDKKALVEYLTFQNFFTERTLFDGVSTLPAGHFLRIDSEGREKLNEYWDYDFREPESPASHEEYVEELDRLLKRAVTRQLVSDVEVGSYLSGGLDSGTITAIAAQELPYIKSFTVGFDMNSVSGVELNYDEREKAEYMSYLFKTEHYEMVLKAGDMERCLEDLVWHLEEPRVGQSYPNFFAAKLASRFDKVVLAGTGSDEIFGGYPWRYYRAVVNDDFEHYIDQYYLFWQRLIPNAELKKALAPIWSDVSQVWTRDIMRDAFKHHADQLRQPQDYINHSLYFEAKTFLHGLLTVEDKLSMAHGLESRVPFLDNDLVDFAQNIPVNMKLGNLSEVVQFNENYPGLKINKFFEKTHDGKLLLRDVMGRYVPDDITKATKQGFSAPDATWFRGESIDLVNRTIMQGEAMIFEFLDRETIQNLVSDHLEGRENKRLLIWSLLNLEYWCKKFLH